MYNDYDINFKADRLVKNTAKEITHSEMSDDESVFTEKLPCGDTFDHNVSDNVYTKSDNSQIMKTENVNNKQNTENNFELNIKFIFTNGEENEGLLFDYISIYKAVPMLNERMQNLLHSGNVNYFFNINF
jgi:hypothetical protein